MRDIRSEDCLIVIIITKEGLDKDNHPTFFEELKEFHRIISNDEKIKVYSCHFYYVLIKQ